MIKYRYYLFVLLFFVSNLYGEENLIKNPGFETGDNLLPDNWGKYIWKDDPVMTRINWEDKEAHSGNKCISITNMKEDDTRVGQIVNVKGGENYLITCWAKTENVGNEGLGANISIWGEVGSSNNIKGTSNDWQKLSLYVKVDKGIKQFKITLGLGGYASINTGKAWFDDVEVIRVDRIPENVNMIHLINKENTGKNKINYLDKSIINSLIIIIITLIFLIIGIIYFKERDKSKSGKIKNNKDKNIHIKKIKNIINKISKYDLLIFSLITFILWLILIYLAGIKIFEHNPIDQFTKQAIAWQKGQLYLNEYYPHLELAKFNDKIFVSFPPTPSFIEFPFTLIFGENTPNTFVMMLFTWIAMIFSFFIFLKLTGNRLLSFFSAFVFFWGTQILYLSLSGRVWHQGQLYGLFFSISAFLITLYCKKTNCLFFSGLFLGLAIGCRPFYIFLFPFLLYIAWQSNKKSFKETLIFLTLGALPVGIFIAFYNYIRFNSIFEFGHNYLPHFINDNIRQFGFEFLKNNIFHTFINLPFYDNAKHIISFSGKGTAFWIASPIMILPFYFFLKKDITIICKVIGVFSLSIIWFLLLLHESNGWFQFGYRYGVDLIALIIYFFAASYRKLSVWIIIIGMISVIINIYGVFWFYILH